VQSALVAALTSCAEGPQQLKARDFLQGLSYDELQFIAEFLGASILEWEEKRRCSRAQLAQRIAQFQRSRSHSGVASSPDQDHKMILLLEFLCRSGLQHAPAGVRARVI
jgi:hypothetical protein